jgi:hypothetical protein
LVRFPRASPKFFLHLPNNLIELEFGMQLTFPKFVKYDDRDWLNQKFHELEIAKIEFKSKPVKVIKLQATSTGQNLLYRIVEEEDGRAVTIHDRMIINGIMTDEEMTEYFLSTWPLADILYHIFNGNLNESLSHFRARSSYFSDFDRKCRERVLKYFTSNKG